MIPNWTLWNQKTVVVTSECNLRCIECPLWKEMHLKTPQIRIKSSLWPQVINVVGGESLADSRLLYNLEKIKKCGKKTRLWTNGIQLSNFWEKISPFVDDVMIYCPSHHPEGYRHITGEDHFKTMLEGIECLHEDPDIKVQLNIPVKPYTVMHLQDLYDTFYTYKPSYFFHYNKKDGFEAESIRYIQRFLTVKDCFVLETKSAQKGVCSAYPFGIQNTLKETPSHMLECSYKLLQDWGPQALFKKILD